MNEDISIEKMNNLICNYNYTSALCIMKELFKYFGPETLHNVVDELDKIDKENNSKFKLSNNNVRVDMENARSLIERINKINSYNFDDIVWFENNLPVSFDEKCVEDWKFTGLSNATFVEIEGWNLKDE